MPIDNVPAEVFIRYRGVKIYHVYKRDDFSQPAREYWFTLWAFGSDGDGHGDNGTFDVRELPAPPDSYLRKAGREFPNHPADVVTPIIHAIDTGHFDRWSVPGVDIRSVRRRAGGRRPARRGKKS
jgi:hypothetical protein